MAEETQIVVPDFIDDAGAAAFDPMAEIAEILAPLEEKLSIASPFSSAITALSEKLRSEVKRCFSDYVSKAAAGGVGGGGSMSDRAMMYMFDESRKAVMMLTDAFEEWVAAQNSHHSAEQRLEQTKVDVKATIKALLELDRELALCK